MANRKFPYLKYNLSRNLFHFNEGRKLRQLILEMIIVFQFKNPEIKDKVVKFPISKETNQKECLPENWIAIENIIYIRAMDYIPAHLFLYKELLQAAAFIGTQIFSLLGKIRNNEDRSLLLQYMVLNITGTINIYKTVLKILRESKKSNEWKFLFSCKYFAEEDLTNYFRLLPLPVIQWCTKFMHSHCDDGCYALCFNLWHIGKTTEVFKDYIEEGDNKNRMSFTYDQANEMKAINLAFSKALMNGNENGVHLIFHQYISNSDKKIKIVKNIFTKKRDEFHYDITNIVVYLLSQVDDGELPSWFEEHILFILETLFQESRFHVALLLMFKELQNILAEKENLTPFLRNMLLIKDGKIKRGFRRIDVTEYRDTFMKTIDILSTRNRNSIFNTERTGYNKMLKYVFDQMDAGIAIKLLKEIITDETKWDMDVLRWHTHESGFMDFFWTVPLARYNTIFIEEIFAAFLRDESSPYMRSWIFHSYSRHIFIYFILNYKFENVNSFLKWSSFANTTIEGFERRWVKRYHLLSIIKTILFEVEGLFKDEINIFFLNEFCKTEITVEKDPIKYIEEVITWCLEDDSKKVEEYKKYLRDYLKTSFYEYITKWVTDKKYGQLNKTFAWLSNSQSELIPIKRKLFNDLSIVDTFCANSQPDEYLQFIDKYFPKNWACPEPVRRMMNLVKTE